MIRFIFVLLWIALLIFILAPGGLTHAIHHTYITLESASSNILLWFRLPSSYVNMGTTSCLHQHPICHLRSGNAHACHCPEMK